MSFLEPYLIEIILIAGLMLAPALARTIAGYDDSRSDQRRSETYRTARSVFSTLFLALILFSLLLR